MNIVVFYGMVSTIYKHYGRCLPKIHSCIIFKPLKRFDVHMILISPTIKIVGYDFGFNHLQTLWSLSAKNPFLYHI